ncbi:phage integrase SAM-like domain-containing protein [Pedobacter sp. MC2016-14]|uniref:phage integrase SAM-like domain-containing protein n=1 Tax=Pedobacter sp. MC2016-14 TaxID=2897327 RepID=UPI00351CDE85
METLVGSEFSKRTAECYRTSLKHTVEFLQWKYNISDIDIRKVDHAFITEYDFYLRSVRKCANNSAVKYLKNFGKIILICLTNGLLATEPFQNYKNKINKVDRV